MDTAETARARTKSVQRMRYEAEISVIKKKIGDLEAIRMTLGLTQRKICQLLMVDPSAWSRWIKGQGEEAPPHIYRMLQWYLALEEKYPALDTNFWLSAVAKVQEPGVTAKVMEKMERGLEERFIQKFDRLERESRRRFWLGMGLILAGFIIMAAGLIIRP